MSSGLIAILVLKATALSILAERSSLVEVLELANANPGDDSGSVEFVHADPGEDSGSVELAHANPGEDSVLTLFRGCLTRLLFLTFCGVALPWSFHSGLK